MTQREAIGNSNARQVATEGTLAAVPDDEVQRPPTRRPADLDLPEPPDESRRLGKGMAFGLGVLVGLVPLIAVIGGVVGYLIAGDGGGGQTAATTTTTTTTTAATVDESSSADAAADANGSIAADSTTDTATGNISVLPPPPADPIAPSAEVGDGTVTIVGTLPGSAAERYVREFTLLADAFGYRLVGEPTLDEGAPVPTEIPVRFADVVFFGADSDHLEHDLLPMLDAVAMYLVGGSSTLTIVSHTDASGSETSNLHLAQHRAGVVFQYLVDRGVPADQLRVDARGESEASGAMGADARSERRVEFILGVGL